MIRILLTIFCLHSVYLVSGQSLDRQLFSSSGSEVIQGNFQVSYSLGEPIVALAQANGVLVAQGFQQGGFLIQLDKRLIAKAWLQGTFSNGAMIPHLANLDFLPLAQPYHEAPWFYNGNESITQLPANAIDWVLMELRTTTDTIVARRAGLLLSDGSIVDMNGQEGLLFDQVTAGSYYLVIDHRNHMPIMTAQPVPVPSTQVYDLATTGGLQLYGNSPSTIGLGGNNRGMIAGDLNKNRQLKYSGPGNDRSLILQQIEAQAGPSSITALVNGYFRQDVNLNGQLRFSGPGNDASIIITNLLNLTGSSSINTVYSSPVPQGTVK